MIALNVEQRSKEWFEARLGIPTASEFSKVVTTAGKSSQSAKKYMQQLAGERVSGISEEGFNSVHMEKGRIVEAEARNFYELAMDCEVNEVGVCYRDDEKKYACSPDGLIGDDGMVEIKCPKMSTHVGYLLDNKLPTDYVQQVQGQLFITGRKWCDFVSYYPSLKPLIVRVERNEAFIKALELNLDLFCAELDGIVSIIAPF